MGYHAAVAAHVRAVAERCDVVVLAQASMAPVVALLSAGTPVLAAPVLATPVLASPVLAVEHLAGLLRPGAEPATRPGGR